MVTMKLESNSIEKWAEELWNEVHERPNVRSLSKDEKESLFLAIINEPLFSDPRLIKDLEEKKLGLASMIWLRVKYCHDYRISPALCVYLTLIVTNPGKSTMVVNYLQYVAKRIGKRDIGMREFAEVAFPNGVPSDDLWKKMWDMQKVDPGEMTPGRMESDNVLDYPGCAETIRFTPVKK